MPDNVKMIRTKDFIKAIITGVLDFSVSKEALLGLAVEIEQSGENRILVDTREAQAMLSMADFFDLGEFLAAHPVLRQSKIAFLASMSEAKQAEFFENVAVNRGVRVKAFVDSAEAVAWLAMQ